MDYQLQQDKITSRIAEHYAISVSGINIRKICELNIKCVLENNDFSHMA